MTKTPAVDPALLAPRTLHAIVTHSRAMTLGCDERPLDALLRRTLQVLPALGSDLFDAPEGTVWAAGRRGFADIVGSQPGKPPYTHLIETKALGTAFNLSDKGWQLDVYRASAPDSARFVVMPHKRAVRGDEVVGAPDSKGVVDLTYRASHPEGWSILTWEMVADWLAAHLPAAALAADVDSDPGISLVAELMRVKR